MLLHRADGSNPVRLLGEVSQEVKRVGAATTVLTEMMGARDKAIPGTVKEITQPIHDMKTRPSHATTSPPAIAAVF